MDKINDTLFFSQDAVSEAAKLHEVIKYCEESIKILKILTVPSEPETDYEMLPSKLQAQLQNIIDDSQLEIVRIWETAIYNDAHPKEK